MCLSLLCAPRLNGPNAKAARLPLQKILHCTVVGRHDDASFSLVMYAPGRHHLASRSSHALLACNYDSPALTLCLP